MKRRNPVIDIVYEAGEVAAQSGMQPEEALETLAAAVPLPASPEEAVTVFLEGFGDRLNPSRFGRCVSAVQRNGGLYNPSPVRVAGGKRKAGRNSNPLPLPGFYDLGMLAQAGKAIQSRALKNRRNAAQRGGYKGWLDSLKSSLQRNPLDGAIAMSEEFHGRPVDQVIEIEEVEHTHDYLAELGKLVELTVKVLGGGTVKLSQFQGALLCANEEGTQLYVRGGDQAVDLSEFGIEKPYHDRELLGTCSMIRYHTVKEHLGDQGGNAVYYHKFGEERRRRPSLSYTVRDRHLHFEGGSYTVQPEGITN